MFAQTNRRCAQARSTRFLAAPQPQAETPQARVGQQQVPQAALLEEVRPAAPAMGACCSSGWEHQEALAWYAQAGDATCLSKGQIWTLVAGFRSIRETGKRNMYAMKNAKLHYDPRKLTVSGVASAPRSAPQRPFAPRMATEQGVLHAH